MNSTGTSPQLLRRTNMGAVLDVMRGTGVVTVTELMAVIGLTRTTVIAVCDDLLRMGWIEEVEGASGPQVGRPARRFLFNDRAGFVVGVDVGAAKTTAVVADMTGRVLGRATQAFTDAAPARRLETVDRATDLALAAASVADDSVLAAAVGIAAPVDRHGRISHAQEFWEVLDIGVESRMAESRGWPVQLANDANLAALAERWRGVGAGVDDLVVMLAGERIGLGVLEDGRLLRGSRGGAGEVGNLDLVRGVGSPDGIAQLCRAWGTDAVRPGAPATVLRDLAVSPEDVSAEMVFRAADAGDEVARQILSRVAERMARVVGLLGTFFDPELVVVAGAVAASAAALLDEIEEHLSEFTATPPGVAVSVLGEAVVSIGAVRLALDHVERHALDLELHTAAGTADSPAR